MIRPKSCNKGLRSRPSTAEGIKRPKGFDVSRMNNKNPTDIQPKTASIEQIFNRLGKTGIIKSTRGKKGGYELAIPPEQITVLHIVTALEGDIEFVSKSDSTNDVIVELFQEAENKLKKALSVNLADLVTKQQSLQKNVIYDI